ncbi:hypothetical protein STEG23_031091, partial [Scotinomys teguina]
MDFREILLIASKGQGVNHVPKRYSLAVGPPKKDPKVKGVQSAAVQAFLRRKEEELRRKALEEKRKKEELVKRRIELKHDKKARAMAKRTKDNFHGYDGVPLEEKSKKRQTVESHLNQGTDQEYEVEEEEFLDYSQAELEQEYEEEPEPPKAERKPKAPLKSAPPPMNFTDLLRLAEKKQFEPVEIKAVKRAEERPMTAEELREREFLDRKHKKKKPETDTKLPPPVSKRARLHEDSTGTKPSKGSGDRQLSSKGLPFPHAEKKPRPSTANGRQVTLSSSSKSMPGERTKAGSGSSSQPPLREGHNRPVINGAGKPRPSTCSPSVPKTSASGTQKSASEHKAKKPLPSHPSHSKPGPTVLSHNKAKSPGIRQPGSNSGSAPGRPSPGTVRPTVSSGAVPRRQNGSSSSGLEHPVSGVRKLAGNAHPSGRPASSSTGPGRPISGPGVSGRAAGSSGGPGRPVNSPHDIRRPMSSVGSPGQSVSGPRRSISGSISTGRTVSSGPGRPVSSLGPGPTVSSPGLPIKPRCTVVSETISSKNIVSRSSNGQINGRKPLLTGYRSAQGPQRPPFPSGYKRPREYEDDDDDDEYDSEMDDFIEDEGEPQEEISKHIREIFGYDRKKYKDESDYALRYMESSWKEQQKEEAKRYFPQTVPQHRKFVYLTAQHYHKYKFRDLTVEELKNVNAVFPHFRYSMDTYVFKDTSQKDLLNFTGTIPVMYQGNTYNIPIRFWILDSHPFAPPICFLKPTANMEISVGKHVDAIGRIYLPYLQNWSHPKSVIVGLIKEMIAKFQEELPLYSVPSSNEAQQVDLLAYITKITGGVSDINSKGWTNHENKIHNKITVVGSGDLGIACTLAISAKGIADTLTLLDLSDGTNQGTMDLDIFNLPNVEISKDLSASAHSKVVIFTANSLGGSESYLHAVQSNVDMFRALVPALGHYSQHAVFLVASQPVEIMSYVTWKLSTFPANRVIGIGCNLDSQRLQYIIMNVLKAQTSGKEVWVIGEQGENKEFSACGPFNKLLVLLLSQKHHFSSL